MVSHRYIRGTEICIADSLCRAISQNEEYYPDPEEFRPERYTDADALDGGAPDPKSYVFGFGRR